VWLAAGIGMNRIADPKSGVVEITSGSQDPQRCEKAMHVDYDKTVSGMVDSTMRDYLSSRF